MLVYLKYESGGHVAVPWQHLHTGLGTPAYRAGHTCIQGWAHLHTGLGTPAYRAGHTCIQGWAHLHTGLGTPTNKGVLSQKNLFKWTLTSVVTSQRRDNAAGEEKEG